MFFIYVFSRCVVFIAHQNDRMGMLVGSQLLFFFWSKRKYQSSPWGLTPPTPGGGSGLPSPTPVWAQRLPGAVLSNTRFTFYLLLNIFTFLWVAICTEKPVILVLYNSTFLVDCCVEFCEKYLRKGLYCINKFFVSCERWVETDISSPFPLQLTYQSLPVSQHSALH